MTDPILPESEPSMTDIIQSLSGKAPLEALSVISSMVNYTQAKFQADIQASEDKTMAIACSGFFLPWERGKYAAGDVRTDNGKPYECMKAHDSTINTDWTIKMCIRDSLGATVEKHTTRWSELNEEIRNTEDVLQTQQAEFDAANASMQDNQKTISDYEMLLEAAMSGSAEKITSALAEIQRGVDTSLEAGSEAALQQAKGVSESLLNVLQMQADGIEGISQSAVDGTTEAMGMAINTISTSGESMKQLLESVGTDGAIKMLMAFQQADMGGNLSAEAQSGMPVSYTHLDVYKRQRRYGATGGVCFLQPGLLRRS